jgi:ubiquinone/menaquinone biosynthesis C-methylase UbiE
MSVQPIIAAICCCLISMWVTLPVCAQEAEGGKQGRLFPPERIEELDEPREWQKAEQIMEFLDIEEGYVIADIGTGTGYFALYFADLVGESGLVYAEDIQPEMVEYTREKINDLGLTNVKVVLGKPDDPGLPENSLDLAMMANVYHEVDDPVALLKSIARSLKEDGRLVIIDWRIGRGDDIGPPLPDRIPRDAVEADAEETGYYTVRHHPFLYNHYFLIFKKKPSL